MRIHVALRCQEKDCVEFRGNRRCSSDCREADVGCPSTFGNYPCPGSAGHPVAWGGVAGKTRRQQSQSRACDNRGNKTPETVAPHRQEQKQR